MAKINRILTSVLLLSATTVFAQTTLPDELPEPSAVNAFEQYWNAFEEYEDRTLKEGRKKFKAAWADVQAKYSMAQKKLNSKQIAMLTKAAKNYRKQLEEHPTAVNHPYVMLNLAQILNMLGNHYASTDANAGAFTKNDALALLRSLEEQYKDFEQREKALYLRALILESMDKREESLKVWKILADIAKKSIHGVHAHIAVGDHYFQIENPASSMRYYQKALELLPDVEVTDSDYERLRINYRLAWAAYRAAELDETVKAASALLQPGQSLKSSNRLVRIQSDAVELIGNSLYEAGSVSDTKTFLKRRELKGFAAAIGLLTLTRYNGNNIHSEAIKIGTFLTTEFPLSAESPTILNLTADSFSKAKSESKRIEYLERLALLLPSESLWRSRQKDNYDALKNMENLANSAAIAVANWHYDKALASGNGRKFMTAAAFYEILIDHAANVPESNTWRLRKAHCFFFAGRYKEAGEFYSDLKNKYKVDTKTLQIASYQLVLTNEKFWRDLYGKSVELGNDPLKDKDTISQLESLEKSIDEFAARFPNQSRSIDLLLVGASANRDMERFEKASNYWQRVMVSSPSDAQRGVAIRGLVFASMKNGSSGEVVQLAAKFLKMENWRSLGLNLGKELQGILSIAALDEGKRLNNSGEVKQAGELLVQIAQEFPDMPKRDKIYRDGAYLLAISGDWDGAGRAVDGYMKTNLQQNRADMTYLDARSAEYQLRMGQAAKSYLALGLKYPRHSRAQQALDKAENLSVAESDYATAAQSASLQAERSKSPQKRLAHYTRAIEHLSKANNPQAALQIARRRLKSSRTTAERFTSEIMVSKMLYQVGNEQEALDDMTVITRQVQRQKEKLSREQFGEIAGESHFFLGMEARRKFTDFNIEERRGGLAKNVAHKTRYFDDLASEMDKAAAAGDPTWSSRARFELAVAAETLADEIAAASSKAEGKTSAKSLKRFDISVNRLKQMAKKYHSTNLLVARKNPGAFKNNPWIKKSSLRLTGQDKSKYAVSYKEELPSALNVDLPSEWSL